MDSKICIAPWKHFAIGNHPRGTIISPCCRFSFKNSQYNPFKFLPANKAVISEEYFGDIRKRMLNGEQLPECAKCWMEENNSVTSMRQKLNREFHFDDRNNFKPKYIEIMFSNLCNLACRMCDITQSSSWATLYNKTFVPNGIVDHTIVPQEFIVNDRAKTDVMKFDMSELEKIDLSNITKVKILGGEPMLSPEHESFLQSLVKQIKQTKDLTLVYHTNCTKKPSQSVLEVWKSIGKVELNFSIDGFNTVNEYQRINSSWQDIVDTLQWYIDLDLDLGMNIHSVLSNITIWSYEKLLIWTKEMLGYTANTFDFVQNPKYLSLTNLPDELKTRCKNMVNDWSIDSNKKELIVEYMNTIQYNKELWQEFVTKMSMIDKTINMNLIETVPELKGFL